MLATLACHTLMVRCVTLGPSPHDTLRDMVFFVVYQEGGEVGRSIPPPEPRKLYSYRPKIRFPSVCR